MAGAYLTNNAPGKAWAAISIAQARAITGIDPFPAVAEEVKQTPVQLPVPLPHGAW